MSENQIITEEDVLFFFRRYIGVKLHFTNNRYTYNQEYLDKKINSNSMDGRKDIGLFIKLTKKMYDERELFFDKLVTMLKNNPNSYILDMNSEELTRLTIKRMHNIHNIDDVIEKDYMNIVRFARSSNMRLCKVVNFNNDRPLMMRKRLVSDEFVTLLNKYYSYLDQPTINHVFENKRLSYQKYCRFVPLTRTVDEILTECARHLTES